MVTPAFSPALLARVEDAALNASAPPGQRWLDGWLVRTQPGKARRARCVHAMAEGLLPLDEKLARAEAFCQADGVPLIFRITPFTQPATLPAALAARGFVAVDETLVMIATALPTAAPRPLAAGTELQQLDADAFAEAAGRLRQSPAKHRTSHALRLRQSPTPYHGSVLQRQADGELLACGQWAAEAGLVGLYDIVTAPEARNQGLASLLCEHLLSQAASAGADMAYLQVDAGNAPALAVYRRLGFVEAYRYHYLEQPPG
jgi:ribosomal protein S18 acetylase RimI-like enzyme